MVISLLYIYVYVLYTIFQCKFNGIVHFTIRLTIFSNFLKCVIYTFRTHFSMWIQLWCLIWCQTNHFRQFICFICYTTFSSVNSAITVIMSSGEYILIIYDIVIIFQCKFSCKIYGSLCRVWAEKNNNNRDSWVLQVSLVGEVYFGVRGN